MKIDTLITMELWRILEEAFIRAKNITFDRYTLLTTKQIKRESVEHFYENLRNCQKTVNSETKKTLLRDLFIANMQDSEIRTELLKETVTPAQALCLAINIDFRQRNEILISDSQPHLQVNAVKLQRQFPNSNQRQNFKNRLDRQIKFVEIVTSLGPLIIMINVLQKVKPASIVALKTTLLMYAVNQSSPLQKLAAPM